MPTHDIVVVSDLHMGRGKNPETGRYHRLETFFYDDDFRQFCQHICNEASAQGRALKLIFNGDAFDFLRIEPEEAAPSASLREKRYGPILGAAASARMVTDILRGHPRFVDGLAHVLQSGHEIIFLPGNHDAELQWQPVQDALRAACIDRLRERAGDAAAETGSQLLRFETWFYYEPGRVWLEHGCQYDPENAYIYPLRAALPDDPAAREELERDMPLGNFFQRYLYNHFGHITFIVPSTRANLRYMKFLLVHQPRLLARVFFSHVPFMFQVLRRLARSHAREALKRSHEQELARLADDSGLGDKLRAIDGLKEVRADVSQATRALTRQFIRLAAAVLTVSFLTLGLYFIGFLGISELKSGFGLKSILFLSLNFVMLLGIVAVFGYAVFRMSHDVPPRPLRVAAEKIAALLDVPIVSFGHTHDEVVSPLRRQNGQTSWYYNTGTWIAVFTHDVLLPRERVQFTYLRIRDQEADLLQWSPGRGAPMPVILLDEGDHDAPQHPTSAPT